MPDPEGAFASPRKRVAFVINSIGQGGAERVLQIILSHMGQRPWEFDVHLVLLDSLPEAREMPAYITKHTLDGRGRLGRSYSQLRRRLSEISPDLVVSLLVRSNLAASMVKLTQSFPLVICERMHLSSHLRGKHGWLKYTLLRSLIAAVYRVPDRVLGVSTGVTSDLQKRFFVPKPKLRTIFNPYPLEDIQAAAAALPLIKLPPRFLVAVGRLEASKNYAQLLRAYAASGVKPDLVILGDGSLRHNLHDLATSLGIAKRVHFVGFVANPYAIIALAEGYVSASLNEGFPNAMVEALALGRAVLASDCPSGPAEILGGLVETGDDPLEALAGILVRCGSQIALEAGLRRLVKPEVRHRFEASARKSASRFDADLISIEYSALFRSTIGQGERLQI